MDTEKKTRRAYIKSWSNVGFALADLFAIPIAIACGIVVTGSLSASPFGVALERQHGTEGMLCMFGTVGVLVGIVVAGIAAGLGCLVVWSLSLPFDKERGGVSLGAHIPLSLLTGGLYQLFWIGHCTEYLNGAHGEEHRVANSEILMCLFVPFYWIYWYHEHAQRTDWMADYMGLGDDKLCTGWYMFFVVVFPPVASIMLQCRLNVIDRAVQNRELIVVHTADVA